MMLDNEIRFATCKIDCGDESGTGWLVAPGKVITALHCVTEAISKSTSVAVSFGFHASGHSVAATVVEHDEAMDVCLLALEDAIDLTPLELDNQKPLNGATFYAWGWPAAKLILGHRLEGHIAQVLDPPKLGMDIEIHISEATSLSDYEGFSGAALICEGACVGMLRVSLDNTIGAISMAHIRAFLERHSLLMPDTGGQEADEAVLVARENFTQIFDVFISTRAGSYVFLEGAHGIGKSTFCSEYSPLTPSLEYFATYSFASGRNDINTVQMAQPKEFVNWLNARVSKLITQSPGRLISEEYSGLIRETEGLLKRAGEDFRSRGKTGVLFIDGIDEVAKHSKDMLTVFIGLLPQLVPTGLVVILSAPSYRQFSGLLSRRLNTNACISIPALSANESREVCLRAIKEERYSILTQQIICERAQGHPLYLRYLIDLANTGTDDNGLSALPPIEGSIRNYYEAVWAGLQDDAEVVNLLSIITRLRWGISVTQFTDILNPAEQAVLVSTISRLQHLLLKPNETTIYHASFSEFLQEKTQLMERPIQLRLTDYCQNHTDDRYGLINIIHHGLRAGGERTAVIVAFCDQKWIDDCVTAGANPDLLLGDIRQVLEAATLTGNLVDTIRLLLLSQRLLFRYDTLFAQSAKLAAHALIALGKTQEALQHVIRYGQLLLPITDALEVALTLAEAGDNPAALRLLELVETSLDDGAEPTDKGMTFDEFLVFHYLKTQLYHLQDIAGDQDAKQQLIRFDYACVKNIERNVNDKDTIKKLKTEIMINFQATMMCLKNQYVPLSLLCKHYSGPLDEITEPLIYIIVTYQKLCDTMKVLPSELLVNEIFSDLQTLTSEHWDPSLTINPMIIDSLISLNAPIDVIAILSNQIGPAPSNIKFLAKDGVSLDVNRLYDTMASWKRSAFLDPEFPVPEPVPFSAEHWSQSIGALCQTIAWADGAARRNAQLNDVAGVNAVWDVVLRDVFTPLAFSLKIRSKWDSAYALPEAVVPHLYLMLARLVLGLFPSKLTYFLSFIEEQFELQCGIYSEGFRRILSWVIDFLTSQKLDIDTENKLYDLTKCWQEFVLSNLKNRIELVPELLTIVPLFVRLNAEEEAHSTYQAVLAHSMGPGWYKEDQFSLLNTALKCLDTNTDLNTGILSQIASLLDAASGEMTFQRFVRYAKRDFIAALCQHGSFAHAIDYYIIQTYGSLEQLYDDATQGEMDRLSPFEGARFPGGMLDEQDALCQIITAAIPQADWSICWALLETFQFGDNRHLHIFAEAYALIMNKMQDDTNAISEMSQRLLLICEADVEQSQRLEFLSFILKSLTPPLKHSIQVLFSTEISSEPTEEPTTQEAPQHDNDALVLPGTFGTQSSMATAREELLNANRQLRRRNKRKAREAAVSGLRHIQNGGWTIWANSTEEITRAQSLLLEAADSVSEIIQEISSLIVDGRFSEKWRIADSLINWLAGSEGKAEKTATAGVVVEHVRFMLGNIDALVPRYSFMEEACQSTLQSGLIKLLLHAVNHPTWMRAEKAAEMLLWLLRSDDDYIPILAPEAFTMKSDLHPDLICGALDILSTSNASETWDLISPTLDTQALCNSCHHVGRFTVLLRLARRASLRNNENASSTLHQLQACNQTASVSSSTLLPAKTPCPLWAESMTAEWHWMLENALLREDVINNTSAILDAHCSPVSIDDSLALEKLLAEGYRGNNLSPSRWEARVRFAFQCALFMSAPRNKFSEIEQKFRVYNPTELARFRITDFSSPATHWLWTFKSSGQFSALKPIHQKLIFLDFNEIMWVENKMVSIRVTAYLHNSNTLPQLYSGSFTSTELPSLDSLSAHDVCTKVIATPTYFGSFTPAIPSTPFMRMTHAKTADIHRCYWRSGRHQLSRGGAPEHEGCYLAINNDALSLPAGINLIWVVEYNNRPVSIITLN